VRSEAGGFRGGAACLTFFLQEAISLMLYAYLWGAALLWSLALIYHALNALPAYPGSPGSPGILPPARGVMPVRETSVDGLP